MRYHVLNFVHATLTIVSAVIPLPARLNAWHTRVGFDLDIWSR